MAIELAKDPSVKIKVQYKERFLLCHKVIQTRAMHIVALVPFVIGALIIGPEMQYIVDYHIKSSSCYPLNCPDVVLSYEGVLFGSIPVAIGAAILTVDWIKQQHNRQQAVSQ